MHIHVTCEAGEAKFWIEPVVALADYTGLKEYQLLKLHQIVEDRKSEIKKNWKKYFS